RPVRGQGLRGLFGFQSGGHFIVEAFVPRAHAAVVREPPRPEGAPDRIRAPWSARPPHLATATTCRPLPRTGGHTMLDALRLLDARRGSHLPSRCWLTIVVGCGLFAGRPAESALFGPPSSYAANGGARSVALGDVNRDGRLDLLITNDVSE